MWLAALAVTPAQGASPPDLPLEKVTALLKAANVEAPWSVAQYRLPSDPDRSVDIFALSEKVDIGERLCRTQATTLQLKFGVQDYNVVDTEIEPLYAFAPCSSWLAPDNFHPVSGNFDPVRLDADVTAILNLISGRDPTSSEKVEFKDESLRQLVGRLRDSDVLGITVSRDGATTVTFVGSVLMMRTLGVTLSRSSTGETHLVVRITGDIDVIPTTQPRN
jgi:hypothetical protein